MTSVILQCVTSTAPGNDVQIYSGLFTILAFGIAFKLTRVNHLQTRRSSTVLLTFYPLYSLAQLTSLRTSYYIHKSDGKLGAAKIAVIIVHILLVFIVWMLECVGPEMDEMVDGFVNVDQKVKESPFLTANFYSR